MKFKFSLRQISIVLFAVLFLGSLLLMNSYFMSKHTQVKEAVDNLKFDQALAELHYQEDSDRAMATKLAIRFRESMAGVQIAQTEARIYSQLYMLGILIIGIGIFILAFHSLTKPLKELEGATKKIIKGDYNLIIPETGIDEIRQLKASFNLMSRELEETQKRLLVAEKEMIWKELSRILAHEIKNPLTPIQLSIDRLEDKYENNQTRFYEIFPAAAEVIKQEIGNLRKLVRTFSSFAKAEKPHKTKFNINDKIISIIAPYQHDYNIECHIIKQAEISFDETHFYQIITNILQNAIDACDGKGCIKIACSHANKFYVLEIKDQGPGIKPEYLAKIFEPYFTKKKRGTGLGLALVKKLVELNSSFVRVKSKIGQGTSFSILIPEVKDAHSNH